MISIPFIFLLLNFSNTFTNSHKPPTMDLGDYIVNQTDVSLSLAKHVISTEAKDTNLVFSLLSIHVVLGLIAAGSSGPTWDQILEFLKSKSVEELNTFLSKIVTTGFSDGGPVGGPRISFANGVWIDQSLKLKPTFKKIVDEDYKVVSNDVDFLNKAAEVEEEVNTSAAKETNDLIKELLPYDSVDDSTRLIFANALYFKGTWNQEFYASETYDDDFFLLNSTSIRVPFMTSSENQKIRAFDGFNVLEPPYKQGEAKRDFSLYIFLPDAKDGLPALLEKISTQSGLIDHHRPYQKVEVGDVRIPKFKIEFGFEASEVLNGLGVVLPFHGGGLTEMLDSTDGSDFCVFEIFHKSFIEVNEEGTEAAAASAGLIGLSSQWNMDEIDFVADHRFAFVLRENTNGVVFFIGQVLVPSS